MSAIGVFGGTFDPVHLGHLITAQAVRQIRNLKKIIFIPAFISPHKTGVPLTSGEHRLNMIKIALKGINYFEYSDIELKSKTISYSINTLRRLKEKYDEIELIIGYDNIIEFKTWKEPDEILRLARLIVLKRKASIEPRYKDRFYKAAVFVETPAIEISSSEIRKRIKENKPVDFLVPDKVKKYISDNHLYMEK